MKNLIDAPAVAVDSASEGRGTVSRSAGKAVEGMNITYTATPKPGNRFIKWVEVSEGTEKDVEGAGASYTITVDRQKIKRIRQFSPLLQRLISAGWSSLRRQDKYSAEHHCIKSVYGHG